MCDNSLRICLDLDGTICTDKLPGQSYEDVVPLPGAVETINRWKDEGHYIIIQTARHMKTHAANEGKIVANIGYLYDWLKKWNIPYDELYIGKPHADIFIDDKGRRHTSWDESDYQLDAWFRHKYLKGRK